MANHEQINRIRETIGDIFSDLHHIQVADERSREAKQDAILLLISMRKILENLSMGHRR